VQLVDDVTILKLLAGHRIQIGATCLRQHAGGGVDVQLRKLRVREVDVGVVDAREHRCGFANAFPELRKVFISGEFVALVALSRQILRFKSDTLIKCRERNCIIQYIQYGTIQVITEFRESRAIPVSVRWSYRVETSLVHFQRGRKM